MKGPPVRVYFRGETWYCDFYVQVPGKLGKKRVRRALPEAHCFDVALVQARELEAAVKSRLEVQAREQVRTMTLDHYIAEVWSPRRRSGYKPATWRGHEQKLRVHILPRFGGKPLHEIKAVDVDLYVQDLRSIGLEPTTINKHLGLLSKLLNDAIRWELLTVNPMEKVDRCKVTARRPVRGWTAHQAQAFLDTARQHRPRWYPLFLTALRTGLRLGELAALKWSDLDLDHGVIHVKRAMSAGVETDTKGHREFDLPIDPELVAALRVHRAQQRRMTRVFRANDGSVLTSNNVKSIFGTCIRHAGVPHIRFHDLRHTYANLLVENGVPLEVLKELLNHSDSRITQRYSRARDEVCRKALERLPSFADPVGTGRPGAATEPPVHPSDELEPDQSPPEGEE